MKQLFFLLFTFFLFTIYSVAQKPILTANVGHAKNIGDMAFSPDGKYIATASDDNTIKLWEVKSCKEIKTFYGHEFGVNAIDFSKDGSRLVTASVDQTIRLWDVETGKEIKTFIGHAKSIEDVRFSDDGGKIVSTGNDYTVRVWDVQSAKLLKIITNGENFNYCCDFSPNGKQIAFGDWNGAMQVYSIDDGSQIAYKSSHSDFVFDIHYSPDGKYILTAGRDKVLILWDAYTYEEIRRFEGHEAIIQSGRISPDSKHIVSTDTYANVKVWDVETGEEIINLNESKYSSERAIFSPDGKKIAVSYGDGVVDFYDAKTFQLLHKLEGYVERISEIEITSDGKKLVSGNNNGSIKIWNLQEPQNLKMIESGQTFITALVMEDDEHTISASWDMFEARYPIQKWNLNTTDLISEIETGSYISCLSKHPKENYVFANNNNLATIWNLSSSQAVEAIDAESNNISRIDFQFEKNYILTATFDSIIKIYKYQEGLNDYLGSNLIVSEYKTIIDTYGDIEDAQFSIDGKYVAAVGDSNLLRIWDYENEKLLHKYKIKDKHIQKLAFSPNGKYITFYSYFNNLVVLDAATGKEIVNTKAHSGLTEDILFHPNGKHVLTCSHDGNIKFWDPLTAKLQLTIFEIENSTDWVAVTPEGYFDGTEKGMQLLHYVKGKEIIPLESFFEQFYSPNLIPRVLSGEKFSSEIASVEDAKLPPLVEIVSPENNTLSSNKEITIHIKVVDQGGGIDEIRLFHNGKLIQTTDRGFKKVSQAGQITNKYFTVQLVEGNNNFKSTAFNSERTESMPAETQVSFDGMQTRSNLYILAVGINEYKNSNLNLNYAIPDAEALVKYLNYGSAQIFKDIDVHFIKNSEATKTQIIEEIGKIKELAQPADVFVFYYAGHGVMGEQVRGIKADYYLIPHDVTQLYGNEEVLAEKAISSKEIMEYSTAIKAQKQLLIMDACQSGGALQAFAARGAAEQKAIMQLARSTGIMVLAASGSEQFATEFNELGHGAFTYALLEGLKCQADGGKKDFKITVSELKAFLEDRLPELTEKYKGKAQYPTGYSRGQDFPIVICK